MGQRRRQRARKRKKSIQLAEFSSFRHGPWLALALQEHGNDALLSSAHIL